jgi:hypothetical protein
MHLSDYEIIHYHLTKREMKSYAQPFSVTVTQLCILYTCMAHNEQRIFVFSFLIFVSPRTSVEQLLHLNCGSYCFGRGEKKVKMCGINLLL